MKRIIQVYFGLVMLALLFSGILAVTNIGSNPEKLDENNTKPKISAKLLNPSFDGVINADEWANAAFKTNFSLDVDNDPDWNGQVNVDGDNYLYLGKNDTHILMAVDLCGDRSNNRTDEWFGVWLNTLPKYFDTNNEWYNLINNSVESLVYDVEYNRTHPFFNDETEDCASPICNYAHPYINDDTEIDPINYSSIIGDYYTLRIDDGDRYQINSTLNITDHVYRLDISVNLSRWFDTFPDFYLDEIKSIKFRVRSTVNVTVTNHSIVLWDSAGNPGFNDPALTKPLKKVGGVATDFRSFYYGLGNLTADNIMKFSLYGNHSEPFEAEFETLNFYKVMVNKTNWFTPYEWHQKYSSIKNYHLKYSFGASPDEATPHRMFEIAIPKNELELYDDDNILGIIVGGYGTLAFEFFGKNYWAYQKTYSATMTPTILIDDSSEYIYYRWTPLPPPGLPTPDDDDDDDDEIDMTLPIILTVVFVSVGAGLAVVVVLVKKGIIDFSKLKR